MLESGWVIVGKGSGRFRRVVRKELGHHRKGFGSLSESGRVIVEKGSGCLRKEQEKIEHNKGKMKKRI